MIITYLGNAFVKVQVGDTVVAMNPIGKGSTYKESRFGSDIALVSLNHPDYNGVEQLVYKDREPFVISGPGEYEVQGIFVKGYMTKSKYAKKDVINTIYIMKFEDVNICHLGAIGSAEQLTPDIKEKIGDIDVLFVPITGGDLMEAKEAYKVSVALAPKAIIPLYDGSKQALEAFKKDAGSEAKPADKLTLKKKDLTEMEGDVVVLKSQA
jgi:L-ascorbate metabolism protein UlaG (beta-lactamase superfamily)